MDIDASASSQFVSALLLAGPASSRRDVDTTAAGPILPHIEMTVACCASRRGGRRQRAEPLAVRPGRSAALDLTIEPDLSKPRRSSPRRGDRRPVTVRGWPSATTQAGDVLREILRDGRAAARRRRPTVAGPDRLRGVDLDLHDVGELTPVLAALCALADRRRTCAGSPTSAGTGPSGSRRSPRSSAGSVQAVSEQSDGLSIRPAPLARRALHTYADHRMAHAGVVVGAPVDRVLVEDVATTGKTLPDFADVWTALL